MHVGGAAGVAVLLAAVLGLAFAVLPTAEPAEAELGVGTGVPLAVEDWVPVGELVGAELVLGDGTRSHGGRLVPVPSCKSLMICSAPLSVETGIVAATSCCE